MAEKKKRAALPQFPKEVFAQHYRDEDGAEPMWTYADSESEALCMDVGNTPIYPVGERVAVYVLKEIVKITRTEPKFKRTKVRRG